MNSTSKTPRQRIIEELAYQIARREWKDQSITDHIINEIVEGYALDKAGGEYKRPALAKWYLNATDKQYFRMVAAAKRKAAPRFRVK